MVYGKGINDSPIPCQKFKWEDGKPKLVWRCPYYDLWSGILYRCYSPSFHKRQPTYADCCVADEWLTFSAFKDWVLREPLHEEWLNKEGDLQLDKDILSEGNKDYTPAACAFIPKYVNTALAYSKNSGLPMGVTQSRGRSGYAAGCTFLGKREYLGTRPDPRSAHALWQSQKVLNLESILDIYSASKFFNPRVGDSLKKRIDRIRKDLQNGEETTHL